MKLILFSIFISVNIFAAVLDTQWSQVWGTPNNDYSCDIICNSNGVSYTAGYVDVYSIPMFDWDDFYLNKFDSNGSNLWSLRWGSDKTDYSRHKKIGLEVDSLENIYIGGGTEGEFAGQTNAGKADACVSKISSDGSNLWTRIWGSPNYEFVYGLCVDKDDNILICGYTGGEFNGQTNNGGSDAFIMKMTAEGSTVWTRIFGTSASDYAYSICGNNDGDFLVSGYTLGTFTGQTNFGAEDIFLSKFSTDGSNLWTKQWGSSGSDYCYNMVDDNNSSIYLTGYTKGEFPNQVQKGGDDIFVIKSDFDGSNIWTRQWGSASNDCAYDVAIDNNGDIYASGYSYGNFGDYINSGNRDFFVTQFDSEGSNLFSAVWGTSGNDIARGITSFDDDILYVCGETYGSLDEQPNNGGYDGCLMKLKILNIERNSAIVNCAEDSMTLLSEPTYKFGSKVALFCESDIDSYSARYWLKFDCSNVVAQFDTEFGEESWLVHQMELTVFEDGFYDWDVSGPVNVYHESCDLWEEGIGEFVPAVSNELCWNNEQFFVTNGTETLVAQFTAFGDYEDHEHKLSLTNENLFADLLNDKAVSFRFYAQPNTKTAFFSKEYYDDSKHPKLKIIVEQVPEPFSVIGYQLSVISILIFAQSRKGKSLNQNDVCQND